MERRREWRWARWDRQAFIVNLVSTGKFDVFLLQHSVNRLIFFFSFSIITIYFKFSPFTFFQVCVRCAENSEILVGGNDITYASISTFFLTCWTITPLISDDDVFLLSFWKWKSYKYTRRSFRCGEHVNIFPFHIRCFELLQYAIITNNIELDCGCGEQG